MPYKLVPPTPGRSPYWRVRGTEFGVYCDRSAQTRDRREAAEKLRQWREEAKRLSVSGARPDPVTFAAASISYMQAGHDRRFLAPLIKHFGDRPIDEIGQAGVDAAAEALYPGRAAQTTNRQVYTPVSAILKHAGRTAPIRRPKGWRSRPRPHYLPEDQLFALLEAASGLHARFGALLTFLVYTGARLSEATRLDWTSVDLAGCTAVLENTKNGETIPVHLPPPAVAALANLEGGKEGRVFRLTKSGRIYLMLQVACRTAGVNLPERSAFHILRHTHAWLRRKYTGADTSALVGTRLWKSHEAARIYEHIDPTEEARKSDLLPAPPMKTRRRK